MAEGNIAKRNFISCLDCSVLLATAKPEAVGAAVVAIGGDEEFARHTGHNLGLVEISARNRLRGVEDKLRKSLTGFYLYKDLNGRT
jgi:hypothetical protein